MAANMSASRVNMNGSDDPFYRYTMPPVQIKVEGTTKMIKTVLTNIEDVGSACGRPIDYLVTYFGQELSANSKVDTKTNKAYVTGNMKLQDIQDTCFKFIRGYVMCGTCKNPETVVTVVGKKKAMTVVLVCKGCGAKTTLDNTDRFVKYMTQHPVALTKQEMQLMGDTLGKKKKSKEGEEDFDDDAEDGGEAEKKKKKKKKKTKGEDEEDEADEEGGSGGEKKKKKKKKKSKGVDEDDEEEAGGGEDAAAVAGGDGEKKKKKKKKKREVQSDDDDDDDWCMDTSEEAARARAEAMNVEAIIKATERAHQNAKEKEEKEAKEAAEAPAVLGVTQSVASMHVADEEVDDIDDI